MNDLIKKIFGRATDYSGSKTRKVSKGIIGVVIVILLGALGLEVTNNDWNLGTLLETGSPAAAKLLRDKNGNVTTDTASGKATDEYNCADFSTQTEAQTFFTNAGGKTKDTNRLDGDNDGIACEDLPAAK